MRPYNKIVIVFILISLQIISIGAQEKAISFNSKGTTYLLNQEQQLKIHLYTGEGESKEAHLYQLNDTVFWLENTYSKEGQSMRQRIVLDKIGFINLRLQVDSLEKTIVKPLNQEGRPWLLAACTSLGLGYYGWAVPSALSLTDKSAVACYMLTAGSFFFVPYFLTNKTNVSYGQANLTYYGLSRGMIHGLMLSYIIDGNARPETNFGISVVTGITEGIFGYSLVNKLKLSDGTANTITVYGDNGLMAGLLLSNQFNLYDNKALTLALFGAASGIGLGYYISKSGDISAGDAEIIRTTGYLGAFLPVSTLIEISPNNTNYITNSLLLFGIGGMYAGHLLVKNQDFSFSQGFITELGTLAGGLFGTGLGYLINDHLSFMTTCGAIGGVASFSTMYYLFRNSNKKIALDNLHIGFYPSNALLVKDMKIDPALANNYPLISASWNF